MRKTYDTKNRKSAQIKSRQRVSAHGEVFTAEREVKAMCDLIPDWSGNVLEPACGNGNFLVEIANLTPPNEWVSVEERLPEHLKDVLALYGNGKIDIDWVDSSGDFKFGSLFDGVTHWMPLPAPPDRRPPEGEEDT